MIRPKTDAEKIQGLVEFGLTEMEAAKRVAEQSQRAAAEATVEERRDLIHQARKGDTEARSTVMKIVSEEVTSAVPILGLLKVTSDPAEYYVLLDDLDHPRLQLGGVGVLDSQALFGRRFLDTLGWKPHKVKAWDEIVNMLGACITTETPDEALTDAGRGRRWLRQYLYRNPNPTDLTTSDRADRRYIVDHGHPFRTSKGIHIFLPRLRAHIRDETHGAEQPTDAEVVKCIKAAGCKRRASPFPKSPPLTAEDTSYSTWLLPATLDDPVAE